MPRKEPRVICFDLDDTIIATSHLYHQALWDCGVVIHRALGTRSPYPSAVLGLQHQIDRAMIERSGFTKDHFPISIVRTYEQLAKERGIAPSKDVIRDLRRAARPHRTGPFVTLPGAPEVLRGLREDGHELHLVTMGDQTLQHRKIRETGLAHLFKSVHVTSQDKRTAIGRCISGHAPDRCVMIGDSLKSDIVAALALGMIAVHVPGDPWPFAQADVDADAFYRLGAITDVPDFIRSLA